MIHLPMVAKISFILCVAFLAVVDASSNRTLIIISMIGSGTTLFVGIMSALVSLHNSKKLLSLSSLPEKVEEFRKEVDGRMTELKASRLETSVAKQEVARAEGAAQERAEERDRVTGSTPAEVKPVQKVEMVNDENNPANVRAVKGKIT